MKLISAHITNFRSVEDSEPFTLDGTCCLVGKNEAGKSAVLLALASLNPHPSTPYSLDKERDYPRRFLTAYAERHPQEEATVIHTTWKLTPEEVTKIEAAVGEGTLSTDELVATRRYGDAAPNLKLKLDVRKALEHFFSDHALNAAERAPLKGGVTPDIITALKSIAEPTEKQKALLATLQKIGSVTDHAISVAKQFLPTFMYFSTYDRMDGAVQIEQLEQIINEGRINAEEHRGKRLFHEFLDYAGVPLQDIRAVRTFETFNAKLQGASNNITDQVLEYWSQNPDLSVNVTVNPAQPNDAPPLNAGTVARARVYNQLHRVDTPFSERSAGFVWFFSFLVKFAQVKDEQVPVVLLLDEPGLTLHGKAQGELLRFFEDKLSPYHQIIFSTHSPFMVAADQLANARVVEDQVETKGGRRLPLGTKVRADVLSRDPDTLFPLQGALGYEITQTLFVGKHTLLVEGPSDILYLQALSRAAGAKKLPQLDSRWTICPGGGIGNLRSFIALFAGNHVDVTVLTDIARGQKSQIQTLRESQILRAGRVLTMDAFTDKDEADIEDLFDDDVFAALLNNTYAIPSKDAITADTLNAADASTPRLVKKAEALFRTYSPPSGATFDHFAPASWLITNPAFLENAAPTTETTLSRASKLFEELNKLLA